MLNTQVGGAGDADEYSWFLAWMPFALGHSLDPLVSHYVNAPGGVNLMWNTSVILPSFLMSPATVIFGAAFSYNVLLMSGPALTATFSYMAFRRWTSRVAALAGALVVGFSPYMLAQSAGHLAQVLIMSGPLFLIVLDRILVVQDGREWLDGLALGLLAWAQFLTSEEIFAMEVITAAGGVAVLLVISYRDWISNWLYAAKAFIVAGGSFAILSAPFLALQYLGPYKVQDVHPTNVYVSDLLNFIVPTNVTKFAPAAAVQISSQFTGNGSEDNAYIGVPLLLFILLALFLARRRPLTWVALSFSLGAAVLSMGETLHYDGRVTRHNLPYYYLSKLPAVHNLLPDRFASMTSIGVGLLVALGCEALRRHSWPVMVVGWSTTAVGLVALFPVTNFPAAASPLYTAFTTHLACPDRSAKGARAGPPVALMLPVSDEMDLRWQGETRFCFAMPSDTGMTGTNSGDIATLPVLLSVANQFMPMPARTTANRVAAAQEIQQLHISEIIVGPEWPASPVWTPHGQALAVVWVEWLLGQEPLQSKDPYISYIWKDLPPVSDIASGRVPVLPGT
ncbi:MAG TPA: hypothetical protein VL984_14340 [Acidimicrobiales bacterium]|nr:hypothetical protein [Acidimicrobiales bacterium]